jgi:hypothetical protein
MNDLRSSPAPSSRRRLGHVAASVMFALSIGAIASDARAASTVTAPPTQTSSRVTKSEKIEHWATPAITVSIDDSIDAIAPNARAALETAMTTWLTNDGKMPTLSFASTHGQTVGATRDGINAIVAAPITISGYEDALAITITYADDATGAIDEADMIVNTKWTWATLDADGAPSPQSLERTRDNEDAPPTITSCASAAPAPSSCGSRFDVQAILTHESGHFFGLNENYVSPTSTMFYCSNPCEVHKRTPLDVDRLSLASVYTTVIPQASTGMACDVARVGVMPRSRLVGSGLLLGVGLGALVRSRKRTSRARVTIGVRRGCA